MAYLDLDIARRQCAEIRDLVARHPGGAQDYRALQKVQHSCRAASSAVSDRECREHAGAIEDYACELFAGADLWKHELAREIDALLARLSMLQSQRDAVAEHRAA